MLIKNTNPNELLAEFKCDENFCPYNEEELERLKKEGERLHKDVTCDIGIWNNGTHFNYSLLRIQHKEMLYRYGKYGSICEISFLYQVGHEERVQLKRLNKIVFFYRSTNLDGSSAWLVDVTRVGDLNEEVWFSVGGEVKFKKVGY